MGMLFRLLAPKPLKKARRALHPVSLLTPRPVRKGLARANDITHPIGGVKRAAERKIVKSVRGRKPARKPATRKPPPPVARESKPAGGWVSDQTLRANGWQSERVRAPSRAEALRTIEAAERRLAELSTASAEDLDAIGARPTLEYWQERLPILRAKLDVGREFLADRIGQAVIERWPVKTDSDGVERVDIPSSTEYFAVAKEVIAYWKKRGDYPEVAAAWAEATPEEDRIDISFEVNGELLGFDGEPAK